MAIKLIKIGESIVTKLCYTYKFEIFSHKYKSSTFHTRRAIDIDMDNKIRWEFPFYFDGWMPIPSDNPAFNILESAYKVWLAENEPEKTNA